MGKKAKIGKQRKDKYYRLAKEAGYRSRAAFKLIQLNKRFEFLQTSRALVDLCAAPGGWLQVAIQNMPVSSLAIGVDLVPIKPVHRAITLQGDITTEQTRQAIRKELQNWKADCVLHDGAPNVGANWQHDAFQQNCLTLAALRLATQILTKGGWFITKLFRSRDYQAVVAVFEKLFRKVHVWKPAASRLESAEIFVVCEKYLQPVKVDPGFLDPKVVFRDVDDGSVVENPYVTFGFLRMFDRQKLLQVSKKEKKSRALGYDENKELMLFTKINASEFINGSNFLEKLGSANQIILDDDLYENSEYTTNELRECIKDLKVCGPRELRTVLAWRRKLKAELSKRSHDTEDADLGDEEEVEVEETNESLQDEEMAEVDRQIANAEAGEKAALKKKKRRMLREKAKMQTQKQLKMVIEGDVADLPEHQDLFSLARIRRVKEAGRPIAMKKKKNNRDESEMIEALHAPSLLQNLPSQTEQWFSRPEIANLLEEEKNEEMEEEDVIKIVEKQLIKSKTHQLPTFASDVDDGHFENEVKIESNATNGPEFIDDTLIAERPASSTELKTKKRRLPPELLALGEQMIYSAKRRRDIEDAGWNRHTNNDEGLPDWFVEDEKKHCRKELPVTKEQVAIYKKRQREMNARPIKKVAEAKARKRQRASARMEKAKSRAQSVVDNPDLEHGEKMREMKKIYGRAASSSQPKKKVHYEVMTKGKRGRTVRPTGNYKVVDRRMKKDLRKEKSKKKRR